MSTEAQNLTADEREQLLGREFRDIPVLSVTHTGSYMVTEVLIEGRPVKLIGDPQKCLTTYLGGVPHATPN